MTYSQIYETNHLLLCRPFLVEAPGHVPSVLSTKSGTDRVTYRKALLVFRSVKAPDYMCDIFESAQTVIHAQMPGDEPEHNCTRTQFNDIWCKCVERHEFSTAGASMRNIYH